MRFVFMIEARGAKRKVERILLGICAAVVAVAVPVGMARVARTQEAVRHWRQGEAFAHQRQWQEAEAEFRASLKVDPAFFPSREAVASIAWARQDYDGCFREFEQAHRVDPRNPEPLLALGRVHFSRHDFAAAIPVLEQAVAIAPSHQIARKLLATCRAAASKHTRGPQAIPDEPAEPEGCAHDH
jgi:cytochrome c-type biogenesis protein CcmH/NrfG